MRLPPYVFRQANLEGFANVVAAVRRLVPLDAKIVEWYAGVGVLGLALAPDAQWVRSSDINPQLEAPFAAGAATLESPSLEARVTFTTGSAADLLDDARDATVAVVDPPRKGLDAPLLEVT